MMKVEIKPYRDRCRSYYIDGEYGGELYHENGMSKATGEASGINVALLRDAVNGLSPDAGVTFEISLNQQ